MVPIKRGAVRGVVTLDLSRVVTRHGLSVCPPQPTVATAERVILAVCSVFGIERECMMSRQRQEWIAWPRQIAMTICYETTGRSLVDVGEYFAGRDHGTVLHAIQRVKNRVATNSKDAEAVNAIYNRLT